MPDNITITPHLAIAISELAFRFSRSGGKGGQNVNKVETRVELLFDVAHSPSLDDEQRELLRSRLHSRIDATGILRVVVQESRSQWRNRADAVKRFVALLQKALKAHKKRLSTKTPAGARERRIKEKKHRSETKRMRRVAED